MSTGIPSNARGIFLSVTAYGAVGDGVHDDAPAITRAINEAAMIGSRVWFPSGVYLLGSTLVITQSNVRLEGGGVGGSALIRYASTVRVGIQLSPGTEFFDIEAIGFQGDDSDDRNVNFFGAILIAAQAGTANGVTHVTISGCSFDHCLPVDSQDSTTSAFLKFDKCYVHNQPNGLHPPNRFSITNSDFFCDTVVAARCQAIYCFGQFIDGWIDGNRFRNITSQDIQIRGDTIPYQQRQNFRITNNHFEFSSGTSIWIGSDDFPDIGSFIVANNTFRNCNGPIDCYASTAVLANNHVECDWDGPGAGGFTITSGIGLPGHWNTSFGVVVSGNKFVVKQPYFATITFNAQPVPDDTITVGAFTYTFVAGTPITAGQVQIGATIPNTTGNLYAAMIADDGLMPAPNNVLRYLPDLGQFTDSASYGQPGNNVLKVGSWFDHSATFATTSSAIALSTVTNASQAVGLCVVANACIAPLITGNSFVDIFTPIQLAFCTGARVTDNMIDTCLPFVEEFRNQGSVRTVYKNNPTHFTYTAQQLQPIHASIDDGFPVIEDAWVSPQQMTNGATMGRAGLVPIGDGRATAYFWYGTELTSTVLTPYTLPWRWDEADVVYLFDGVVTTTALSFQRVSPGAGQFNSSDSFIAAVNAIGPYVADYLPVVNQFAAKPPNEMIRIRATTAGVAGNAMQIYARRYKQPGDVSTYLTVPQPLITAQYLRNNASEEQFCRFYGGSAAPATKTFVPSPIANPNLPVAVWGMDAASSSLAPIVYAADIVPGVGATITHAADTTSGAAQFFWRIG